LFASSEYDRGDIIMQKSMYIDYPIKIDKAIKQIKPLYAKLTCDIYSLIQEDKELPRVKQDENKATYSMWLDSEDYFIDWQNWSAKKIKRFVDAVGYPYDNAKAYLNGEIVKFIDVEVIDNAKVKHRKRHIGKVIFIKDGCPVVVCKKGLLKLVDIRDKDDNKLMINFRSRFI
jgi:methionyl-tRNA formyltransferase